MNQDKPNVMVGVVTYDGKKYCEEEFMDRLENLSYPLYDVTIIRTDGWTGTPQERIRDGYNKILDAFMTSGYDYLMTLESDIIPPRQIIELLLDRDKDIVGATYFIGFKNDRRPCILDGRNVKRKHQGEWRTIFNTINPNEIDGTLKEAPGGCGLGCVLIKRYVFDKIKSFKCGQAFCDTHFAKEAYQKGLHIWADTGIIVRHLGFSEDWQEIIAKEGL